MPMRMYVLRKAFSAFLTLLFVLVPLAVLMLGAALAAFLWAVDHAQFDDLDTPGVRVLLDDDDDGMAR